MHDFKVIQNERKESFGNYPYEIHLFGKKIAEIEHDYRGDEYFIRLPNGPWIETDRILTGGGPEPLGLTPDGVSIVENLISIKK
jgi:hypothetical protein